MPITLKELRQKPVKELLTLLNEEREQLGKLRFRNNEGKLRRHHLFKEKKKTIARILTLVKENG